jgi:hypothetical protein
MAPSAWQTFEPVTMGHIRGHGVMRLLVYCGSINCSHTARSTAIQFPMISCRTPLGLAWPARRAGHVGADVRPDWSQHTTGCGAGQSYFRGK